MHYPIAPRTFRVYCRQLCRKQTGLWEAKISCIHLAPTFVPSRPSTLLRFSLALLLLSIAQYLPSSVRHSFSATHFPGHCFRLIPASGSFASSAFPVPPLTRWAPPIKQPLALEAEATRFCVPQENGARKRRKFSYVLLNSITLVGFVGSDPEQRQTKGNGSKFTVLSVATQRSWEERR